MTSPSPEVILTDAARPYLEPHATYIVGYSGGPDSTALLHVVHQLARERGAHVIAAHFNHMLRGAASAADAAACAAWCDARGIPFVRGEADVAAYARAHQLSCEDAARRCRFRWFCAVAQAHGARAVLLAHHADDQAETVLLRLLRGAGLRGLAGMRTVSQFRGVTIIRPWLHVPRDTIRTYLRTQRLPVCYDASNEDQQYDRNWIRHTVLPQLSTRFPDVRARLVTCAAIARDADDYLTTRAAALFDHFGRRSFLGWLFPLSAFTSLPTALQRALLYHLLEHVAGEDPVPASFERLEHLRWFACGTAARLAQPLPQPLFCEKAYDHLLLGNAPPRWSAQSLPRNGEVKLHPCMTLAIARVEARGEAHSHNGEAWRAAVCGQTVRMVQYATLSDEGQLCVRPRRPGDRYRPVNGPLHKVKDFFIAAHIPASLRNSIPLIECDGRPVWLAGWRIAAEFAVRASSPIYRLALLISPP